VAVAHYRGGVSRATNLRWEINGTEGDLVITGDGGNIQFATLQLAGGRGGDRAIRPLAVPDRYIRAPQAPAGFAYNVAQAYAGLAEDMRQGTRVTPDFAEAVERHRLLAAIEAASGQAPQSIIQL